MNSLSRFAAPGDDSMTTAFLLAGTQLSNRKEPAKSAATAQPRKKSRVQQLLTEIERQEAVFAELPDNCELPLFDGRQAIESQRKSDYKNTARAAREIETDVLLEKWQTILTRDFGI